MKTQTSLATALLLLGALVAPVGMSAEVCIEYGPTCVDVPTDIGDCGDDGCVPNVCDETSSLDATGATETLRATSADTCLETAPCPDGEVGQKVGNFDGCVEVRDYDLPCLTLACLLDNTPVPDPELECPPLSECIPEFCNGEGLTCLADAPCDNPTWCVRMTLCDGGTLLECLVPQLCRYGTVNCVTDPENDGGDQAVAPNHGAEPTGSSEGSASRIAIGFTGMEAMASTASSEQDPREARCFVYYARYELNYYGDPAGPNPECVGYSSMGPHKVDAFGEIYCIHDSDCATSGTIHTYVWQNSPGYPWNSDMAGYSQFYSGGGGSCPDSPCGYADDWNRPYGTIQSILAAAQYAYDISRYLEGSECRNPYPNDPEPIWMCEGEGGFGSFLW